MDFGRAEHERLALYLYPMFADFMKKCYCKWCNPFFWVVPADLFIYLYQLSRSVRAGHYTEMKTHHQRSLDPNQLPYPLTPP